MTTRILLLTQWFDPEPTFKGAVFARELVRQGFDVEVLTGFPNYPGGKLYKGYCVKPIQREVMDGVRITRVALYPSHDRSAVRRVLNYVSFAASSLFYGLFFAPRADVIYAYHPPLTVGIVASLIRLFRRIPVVYDVQDMWPDTLRASGMIRNERALNAVAAVCNWVYRRVDHIVVLSPGFKRLLESRNVPGSKISIIYNWADESSLSAPIGSLPDEFPSSDRFRIVFAGNMGKAQALDAVLDAATLLQKDRHPVCFVLVGGGIEVERLQREAKSRGLENVVFFPPVAMARVGVLLAAADALLVHLRNDPLFRVTIPSKTQAYMAVGRPVLMAVDGDAADLILKSGGGVVAASENAKSLAACARSLAAMDPKSRSEIGNKARQYYREELALSVGVSKFAEIFKKLADKRSKSNETSI